MEELARRILKHYGFPDVKLLTPSKGYRNHSFPAQLPDGSMVNIMVYKREPGMHSRILRANQVSDFVYSHGLPARHARDSRITRLSSTKGELYAALYDYLPGTTIPWEAYTMKHIKLLGKTMSDIHAVLSNYDIDNLPKVVDEYTAIVNRMRDYFFQSGVQQALQRKLELVISENVFDECITVLEACNYLPYQQALHMDFVRGNILFDDKNSVVSISGILDFEKTAFGSPLFDIARTLAFLIVDCKFKQPDKVRKYFLISGYEKRGSMPLKTFAITIGTKKVSVLDRLVELYLIYDFYKFLRHNPYDYLKQNEHFIRTRDILLDAKLLRKYKR